jgi:hypothetical protein
MMLMQGVARALEFGWPGVKVGLEDDVETEKARQDGITRVDVLMP